MYWNQYTFFVWISECSLFVKLDQDLIFVVNEGKTEQNFFKTMKQYILLSLIIFLSKSQYIKYFIIYLRRVVSFVIYIWSVKYLIIDQINCYIHMYYCD